MNGSRTIAVSQLQGHLRNYLMACLLCMAIALSGCTSGVDETLAEPSTDAGAETPDSDRSDTGGDDLPPLPVLGQMAALDAPRGLRVRQDDLLPGYVLFSPILSGTYYLINRDGQVVHTWDSEYASTSNYLLDDGSLIRSARLPDAPRFNGGGQYGRIERTNWNGEITWSFELADESRQIHHDVEVLPNGNILAIAWEAKSREEALVAGRRPELTPAAGLWPDSIIEIEPAEGSGGRIVWEWRSWEHMIQDSNPSLPNYGSIAGNPRKIDINAGPPLPEMTAERLAMMKEIGFTPMIASLDDRGSDMHHVNSVDYNANLDHIVFSSPELGEIFIIDHGLSTEEAATDAGDPLYRWGNPENYDRDDTGYTLLGYQHDVHWIPDGQSGAGSLMLFNNRAPGAEPPYSEVLVFAPPVEGGRYVAPGNMPFGPAEPQWRYHEDGAFSPFISGARRLPNGNTLITYGPQGRFVEVTPAGEIVWEYWTPYSGSIRLPDGSRPSPVGPFMYATFRATFIPADHPGLDGRSLEPLAEQPAPSVLDEAELAPFMQAMPAE